MLWILAVVADILLETAIALYLRKVAARTKLDPVLSTAITYVGGVLPVAIVFALLNYRELVVSTPGLPWLVGASSCFVIANILIFRVYTRLDASLYTTINTSKYVVILTAATLVIGDTLRPAQLLGVAIIIAASAGVSYIFGYRYAAKAPVGYIMLAFLASFIVACAQLSERMALGTLSATSYVLFGWGLQALLLAIISARSFVKKKPDSIQLRPLISIGLMRGAAGICVVYALSITHNISLIAPLAATKVVTIALASYLFLGERSYASARIGAAIAATIGILCIVL